MKKLIIVIVFALTVIGMSTPSFAADKPSNSSPLRICFLPGVWYWPKGVDIYGIALGLPVSCNGKDTVAGIDVALGLSVSDHVQGVRASFLLNNGADSNGAEAAAVNLSKNFGGVSFGLFNQATENSEMVQLGLINQSTDSKGIQVGLVCMMDNGFLPIFPFVNFGFGDKKTTK